MHIEQGLSYPPGVTVYKDRISFTTMVPEGAKCNLILYKKGDEKSFIRVPLEQKSAKGVMRSVAVFGINSKDYEYNYEIDNKVVIDPYVKEITGHTKFGEIEDLQSHKVRGVVHYSKYDWEDDEKIDIPFSDVVAYSLHVRGFTMNSGSKVKHKGTFRGIEEKIPYLLDLGVNQIHLMPVYEFEEICGSKPNYWGYGKACYYAPKAAYAGKRGPVRELKDLVKACHKSKIEVILELPFADNIMPQSAIECLRFYMLEYHVDGFVVNPYRIPWEMIINDPYLSGVKLLRKEEGYQNVMRRYLKGDEAMIPDIISSLIHKPDKDGCYNFITAQTGFTLKDLVSYDGKHNEANGEKNMDGPEYNYSWNCGAEGETRKKSILELRRNQINNAFLLLLTCQGTPCILAGDEFGNTQDGNNNVYCQDNEISWLSWSKKKSKEELYNFVRDLIAFRKKHKVLHRVEELTGTDRYGSGVPDISYHGDNAWVTPDYVASRQLGVYLSGSDIGDDDIYIAYNMHWEEHDFAIPSLKDKKKWYKAVDTFRGCVCEEVVEDAKNIHVDPRSIVILVGKKIEENPKARAKDKKQIKDVSKKEKKVEETLQEKVETTVGKEEDK